MKVIITAIGHISWHSTYLHRANRCWIGISTSFSLVIRPLEETFQWFWWHHPNWRGWLFIIIGYCYPESCASKRTFLSYQDLAQARAISESGELNEGELVSCLPHLCLSGHVPSLSCCRMLREDLASFMLCSFCEAWQGLELIVGQKLTVRLEEWWKLDLVSNGLNGSSPTGILLFHSIRGSME